MLRVLYAGGALLFLLLEARPEDPPAQPPILSAQLTGEAWLGSIDGSLQTPAGGKSGTTSLHRPRTDEIGLQGLNWMPVVDGGLRLWEKHEAHFQYARVDLAGRDVLRSELVSQARDFPAGSSVESHLALDLFRLGYRGHWVPWSPLGISLSPEIGFSINPFSYKLDSPSAAGKVDRAYAISFPYLDLLLERPILHRLAFEVELAGSGGINGVSFVDSEARLAWELPLRTRAKLGFILGLKGTWLRRRDSQREVQNDPNLRLGAFSDAPWGGLTLGVRAGI
jgi:hypothetical protein